MFNEVVKPIKPLHPALTCFDSTIEYNFVLIEFFFNITIQATYTSYKTVQDT